MLLNSWKKIRVGDKDRARRDLHAPFSAAFLVIAALALSACNNSRFRSTTISGLLPGSPTSTSDTFTLSTASVTSSGEETSTAKMSLFIDTQKAPQPISNWCEPYTGSESSKRCQCVFTWSEANTESGSSIPVSRKVVTDITVVQPNLVSCNVPGVYSTEIQNGTLIKVAITPGPGNSGSFSSTTYSYVKSATQSPGSFQDYQGRSFMNILRYSCYDQRQRGMSIINKIGTTANDNTGEVQNFPIANRFCVQKLSSSGAGASGDGCDTLPGVDYTAQSNYYNLYVRESEVGDINRGNARFTCPTVNESLGGGTGVGAGGQYWPLDSSFALSLGRTGDFPIGVVANSRAAVSGDPVSSGSACDANVASNGTSNGTGLTATCLGFAARPNSDGSCPKLADSVGTLVQTYRLRRYVALYPQIFDTNGDFVREGQAVDTIYVVDRPVTGPGGESFAMRGPKPCPYSYFDHKGVVNGTNGYYATNDSGWSGKNVDGISMPNLDSATSCSSMLPLLNTDRTVMSVTTTHATANLVASYKKVYMRPIKAWAPHYEEDTAFQACAPLANPLRDAPLHFAKNGDNVAWCAEAYPSQNNNVAKLDVHTLTADDPSQPYTGLVRPFTSHVSKNSTSAACTATAVDLPSNASVANYYPAAGKARHLAADTIDTDKNATAINATRTCDRTVINPNGGLNWPRFPLLAPPANVESALSSALDKSYTCTVSWDNNGSKSGKASPTGGCCSTATDLVTGAGGVQNAHLEPGANGNTACATPAY